MLNIKTYHLPPTPLMPNSPHPLIHYQSYLPPENCSAVALYDLFSAHGWQVQWIARYGPTQAAHYHSAAHECMAVLSGEATIRFGVADSPAGERYENGGIEIHAKAGDIFVLPAGLAHKTFDPTPVAGTAWLTPGDGRGVATAEERDERRALERVELSGFTMMGAYPHGSSWDFAVGGENRGGYERVWAVAKPEMDPVLGRAEEGLCGLWKGTRSRL